MDLRSLFIFGIIAYFSAKGFKHPHIGLMLMVWVGYMNPHRLVPWGIIYSAPVAFWAFLVTVVGYAISKEKFKLPPQKIIPVLFVFWLWCGICTIFAFNPESAQREYIRFTKILLATFMALLLLQKKERINLLVWVMSLSIAFYGIKGGLFALATGGQFRVWGPPDSFIEGNNELALALLSAFPLLYYLRGQVENKWLKRAFLLAMVLCLISVVSSYSRGAFLAMGVTSIFLWYKSKHKLALAMLGFVLVLAAVPFIPEHWFNRMNTIQTYEEDASAMGRINAWTLAFNISKAHITSGGFNHWGPITFALYAPVPDKIHDAHSIYFEVLGEQGFIGLFLFLTCLLMTWLLCNKTIKLSQVYEEHAWCGNLCKMLQVSLIAYMSGGAFLGLAYWDWPYHIMALAILTNHYINKELEKGPPSSSGQDVENAQEPKPTLDTTHLIKRR
ncbi:putative O-glycosylation ligase, exosortase A system-associated [Flocculibacter collagenilyticus]|uniref:putative O-glycosylation ligase, exosortase A system-associated n=1 Tax=Flocculibacter collagenilyticus TaxID=2744479 RepID=UPI0018F6920E|nr:putative O-glycosylation ligase, exosortase A system-associated [Flocculibacter collagenilyticus]